MARCANCRRKLSQQSSNGGKRKYNKKNKADQDSGRRALSGRVQKQKKKKRPLTVFAAFFAHVAKRARDNGDAQHQQPRETMRIACVCWRKLSLEQKKNFEMTIMPGIIKELDDRKSKNPKLAPRRRPLGLFAAFFAYVAKRVRDNGDAQHQQPRETMRITGDCWRKLSPEQKKDFQMTIMPGIIKELDGRKSKDSKSARSSRP